MASFVLVHGSGQDAGCWARVAGELAARGHAVAAPDLPGQSPGWGLQQYADAIAAAVPGPDAVVVAHSMSGVFLPLVALARPCARLVFLAAVVPEPGVSVREQFAADPSMFSPQWIAAGGRWFDPTQVESLAREFLFHDCDEATIAWALTTMAMLDTRQLVVEPAPFARWPEVAVASVVARGDRTLAPEWGRRVARRVLGVDAVEIDGGHCPQVSRPRETADILCRLAVDDGG